MVDQRVVLLGFKEWGAVIRALEEGDQTCIIRKGPKKEDQFDLSNRRFWLVPTYSHQKEDYIQPFYRDYLTESEEQQAEAGEDKVHVQCWVQAKTVIKITKNQRLNWVTDHTIYSPRCLQERFQLQPNEALHMLVVRAYQLSDPRRLDAPDGYDECTAQGGESYVQLKQRIPLTRDNPAISDEEFEERKTALKEKFIREDEQQPDPLLF
ncbi:MAG: DUF1802 family protein [bacterium]